MKNMLSVLTLCVGLSLLAQDQNIVIGKISDETLMNHFDLFSTYMQQACGIVLHHEIKKQLIEQAFKIEQDAYSHRQYPTIFLEAKIEGRIVGYVSFDILPERCMHIRHLMHDQTMVDASIVKDLLLAALQAYPKVQKISVYCPIACPGTRKVLETMEFEKIEQYGIAPVQLYDRYELLVHPKCQICSVLYGHIWDEGQDAIIEDEMLKQGQE